VNRQNFCLAAARIQPGPPGRLATASQSQCGHEQQARSLERDSAHRDAPRRRLNRARTPLHACRAASAL
jgi:hypothetical protein